MFRALFKLVLLLIIVVAVGAYFLGVWSVDSLVPGDRPGGAVGTIGRPDADRARAVAAEAGERGAAAAAQAREVLTDSSLTAKIKAKMALDDTVKARSLNVDTANGVVTVAGVVRTSAERDRALQLARETDGVRQVVDRTQLVDR